MAVIELTPARNGLQVQRPPQARAPVSAAAMGAPGAALAQLGETMAELEARAAQARQADQVAQAQARHITGLADLRGRLEANDPEFAGNPVEAFSAAAARLRDEVAETIPDRAARTAFARQASLDVARDRIEVIRFTARRTAESSRAQLDAELDTYATEWMRASDPTAQARAIERAGGAIAARVNSGVLAADAGERQRQAFAGRIAQAQVLRDINQNPAVALRRLAAGEYGITDPVQQERLASQARTALQTQASLSETALRRQEHQDRIAANEAEKAFSDAQRAGDREGMERALVTLRQRGQPGQYASAADSLYGRLEPPTTPAMEAWLETRLRARDQVLTRAELEQARANRSINDTVYRRGLASLSGREDVRFREAESFVERALEVPSATIPDRDLRPAQREAIRQRNAIVNDLVLERQQNPDVNPLEFVRERLANTRDAGQVVQQQSARTALARMAPEVQTPEGLDQIIQQWADYQRALQNRGWFSAAPPIPRVGGSPVTADQIARWRQLQERAGLREQEAPR